MLFKVGTVAFIMGSASVCTLLSNVLIARMLSKADMGLFSLIISLVMLFSTIALLGRSNALARYFSKRDLAEFNWRKELRRTWPLSLLIIVILVLCSQIIYRLPSVYFFVITIISLIFVYIQLISGGIIRPQRKYNLAMFSQKGFVFLFIILLLASTKFGSPTLNRLLLLYSFSLAIFGIFTFGLASSKFVNGPTDIPKEVRMESLLFWGINISLIAIRSLDKLFIGKLISYDDLAIYVAIFTVMGLYELSSMSLGYVLLPHFGGKKRIYLTRHVSQAALIAAGVSCLYLIWGKKIVHFVYSGKYDEGIPIIAFFILAGICKVLYAIPSSMIGGRLEKKALQLTFYLNAASVLLHIIFLFWFISIWGLKGAAGATLAIWFLRALQGYIIVYLNRRDFSPQVGVKAV